MAQPCHATPEQPNNLASFQLGPELWATGWCLTWCPHGNEPGGSLNLTCAILQLAKVEHLADAAYPHLHLLFSLGHQVKGSSCGLDDKDKLVLKLLAHEARASVCTHSAVSEINGTQGFGGSLAAVVLQHITIPTHAATPQHKPAPAPGLRDSEHSISTLALASVPTQHHAQWKTEKVTFVTRTSTQKDSLSEAPRGQMGPRALHVPLDNPLCSLVKAV